MKHLRHTSFTIEPTKELTAYGLSSRGVLVPTDPMRINALQESDPIDTIVIFHIADEYINSVFGFDTYSIDTVRQTLSKDKTIQHLIIYKKNNQVQLYSNLLEEDLQYYINLGDRTQTEGINYHQSIQTLEQFFQNYKQPTN